MKYYIKAVTKDLSPKGSKDFSFTIGDVYSSDKGYHFCDSAYATMDYFENPLETRYLEIEALDEVNDIGDTHSFRSNKIKVIREIPLDELRKENILFNSACEYHEKNNNHV